MIVEDSSWFYYYSQLTLWISCNLHSPMLWFPVMFGVGIIAIFVIWCIHRHAEEYHTISSSANSVSDAAAAAATATEGGFSYGNGEQQQSPANGNVMRIKRNKRPSRPMFDVSQHASDSAPRDYDHAIQTNTSNGNVAPPVAAPTPTPAPTAFSSALGMLMPPAGTARWLGSASRGGGKSKNH